MEELTERELKARLGEKVSKMSKSFGAVHEDGENSFSKYNYISSNNMTALIRGRLEEYKLSIIPEVVEYSEKSTVTRDSNGNEKNWIRSTVKMLFEIIDTETGYSINKTFFGSDQDTGGKSSGQSITECTKRFYFKLFQVSSKEEIDPDSQTTETPKQNNVHKKGNKGVDKPQLIKDVVKFLELWPGGKVYSNKYVYYNGQKFEANKQQIEEIKKNKKFKED